MFKDCRDVCWSPWHSRSNAGERGCQGNSSLYQDDLIPLVIATGRPEMGRLQTVLLLETEEETRWGAGTQDRHGRWQVRDNYNNCHKIFVNQTFSFPILSLILCRAHSHMSVVVSCSHSFISRGEAMELLRRWFVEDKGTLNVSCVPIVQYSGHSK